MPPLMPLLLLACTSSVAPTVSPVPAPAPVAAPEPAEPPPLPVASEPKYAATHVLVAWQGAVDAPASVTRSEPEAREHAKRLRARAIAGEALEAIARLESDGPSAPRGGSLGVYLTGTMVPEFEQAVASVEVGAIAPLVRTPFGWHVVRRDAVVEADVSHIVVAFAGCWRSSATRTEAEALARIEEARVRLAEGEDFAEVARDYSDDAAASAGGSLGTIAPGQMIPAFDDAAFALQPGQTSDIVKTPYGLHLIRRTR